MIVGILGFTPLLLMFTLAAISRGRAPIHLLRTLPEYSSEVPMVHSRSPVLADHVAPLEYCDKDVVKKLCIETLRWHLARETETLLHFEVSSDLWGFVDDVHFEFDALSQQVYMSSQSRIGKSDFGANRKRLENLRSLLDVSKQ
ncbi:MAG: DUF1499 domain-containing protein [Planctomycetes bacterium]|nr:DUF1499 domain-containing protein [Planctomycetota bacterium]